MLSGLMVCVWQAALSGGVRFRREASVQIQVGDNPRSLTGHSERASGIEGVSFGTCDTYRTEGRRGLGSESSERETGRLSERYSIKRGVKKGANNGIQEQDVAAETAQASLSCGTENSTYRQS